MKDTILWDYFWSSQPPFPTNLANICRRVELYSFLFNSLLIGCGVLFFYGIFFKFLFQNIQIDFKCLMKPQNCMSLAPEQFLSVVCTEALIVVFLNAAHQINGLEKTLCCLLCKYLFILATANYGQNNCESKIFEKWKLIFHRKINFVVLLKF